MIHTLITSALVSLVLVASYTDLRSRRIPNILTVSGFFVALVLRLALGPAAFADGLLGAVVALAVSVPLVAVGAMGGGDAKMLAAVGAFVGLGNLPIALLATALAGGLMALAVVLRRGVLTETLAHCKTILTWWSPQKRATSSLRTLRTPGAVAIPYGVAIGAGAIAGWML